MANRTDGSAAVQQKLNGLNVTNYASTNYNGQIFKHDLLMRIATGKLDQAGPGAPEPEFGGIATDDALDTSGDTLGVLRKAKVKAVVKSTDVLAIAEQAFRIKGSGTSDALLLIDKGKWVYAEDSLTLVIDPSDNTVPLAGFIENVTVIGTNGDGEADVILDADWASATQADPPKITVITDQYVLSEDFSLRPTLAASIDPSDAAAMTQAEVDIIFRSNKHFEVAGTSMTAALATFHPLGGVSLTTAGGDNDQAIVQPRTNPASATYWDRGLNTGEEISWETRFLTGASIASLLIMAKLGLTNALNETTDADQVGISFDTDVGGEVNFQAFTSIGGTDAASDTGIVVAINTEYKIRIELDSARLPRIYIDDDLVFTGAALTDVSTFKPFVGVQALTGAAKVISVRGETVKQNFAVS